MNKHADSQPTGRWTHKDREHKDKKAGRKADILTQSAGLTSPQRNYCPFRRPQAVSLGAKLWWRMRSHANSRGTRESMSWTPVADGSKAGWPGGHPAGRTGRVLLGVCQDCSFVGSIWPLSPPGKLRTHTPTYAHLVTPSRWWCWC